MLASRKEIREQFATLWDKAKSGVALDSGETRIVGVIRDHPEYQPLIEAMPSISDADFSPGSDSENPFLHLGLHIAVREQIALNRPSGVRDAFKQLANRHDRHTAEHAVMQCLAEALWKSQTDGTALDVESYVSKVDELAKQ